MALTPGSRLGLVLYEMLTGKRPFSGEDATEMISAVVTTEPDWGALPASGPAHVRAIITRCLAKKRKLRIPEVSFVRFALDGSLAAVAPAVAAPVPARHSALI